jgi:hypothetical protein
MIDFSNFSHVQLVAMLSNENLSTIHPEIVAHLASPQTASKSTPKKTTKKQPTKVKVASKPTEKEYKVDANKVESDLNQYITATSYSAGYLRLKPKNKNGVVILRKADIAALEAFIKANRSRFSD